jgi:mono/diheme cytochrome c family protein
MASGDVTKFASAGSLDLATDCGKSAAVAALFGIRGVRWRAFAGCVAGCVAAAVVAVSATMPAWGQPAVERGAYLAAASGCVTCHTDAKAKTLRFAGGGPLVTPFGTFYAPNITPDPEHGIGGWSDADFVRALGEGISPGGRHYFPVFPYTSYTFMTSDDARAIKAYLFSLAPVARPSRAHDVRFPFNWRFAQTFWKWLFFEPGPPRSEPGRGAEWNRGAYLVRALVHCGECHTPRNVLGGIDGSRWLAGALDGTQGDATPNITPDAETGIGGWSAEEIADYLETGMNPDGDFAGSSMADVVEHSTSKLTDADRAAIAAYLRSVRPIRHRRRQREKGAK